MISSFRFYISTVRKISILNDLVSGQSQVIIKQNWFFEQMYNLVTEIKINHSGFSYLKENEDIKLILHILSL